MRLIDADEMLYELSHWKDSNGRYHDNRTDVYHISEIRMVCDRMPTVDAVERKRGRWVLDDNPHDGDCRCSVCRIAIDQMHERHHGLLNALTGGKWWTFYKFCPNCGADMRGEANEHNN